VDFIQKRGDLRLEHGDVVGSLHVQPKLRSGTKELGKPKGSVRRHGRLFGDEALDARARDVEPLRQGVGLEPERREILFTEDFSGMDWGEDAGSHRTFPLGGSGALPDLNFLSDSR